MTRTKKNGDACTATCERGTLPRDFLTSTMAIVLATFYSRVRGIKFYDVSSATISAGISVSLQLEPTNPHDSNCVAVYLHVGSVSNKLGHLAREDAAHLAPLIRSGLFATG